MLHISHAFAYNIESLKKIAIVLYGGGYGKQILSRIKAHFVLHFVLQESQSHNA